MLKFILIGMMACLGCASSPTLIPRSSVTGFMSDDFPVVDRARKIWMEHGFDNPGSCGMNVLIRYPASGKEMMDLCPVSVCTLGTPCPDVCITRWRDGRPFIVVSERQPWSSYQYGLGLLWQDCIGAPRGDTKAFVAWWREVEGE